MESSSCDIIAFIGKQLRYQILPLNLLLEVCLTAYSTEEIVEARNTVLEAFCVTTDYTHPRSLQTQDSRKDLLSIIHCLKDFPCAVGEESYYTNNIKLRSAYARLEGLSQIIDTIDFPLSVPNVMMSAQSSSLPDPDGANRQNIAVAPAASMHINKDPETSSEEVIPENAENQAELPMQERAEAGTLPDLGLQALSFNPLPKGGIPDVAAVKVPLERPRVAAVKEQVPQEDNPDDNVEDDITSLNDTTSSSSSTTSSDTSDEDNLPLMSFYQPGPKNGLIVPMVPEQSLPRREGLPPPSRPIAIPPPTRALSAEDWSTDDESTPADMAPSNSKRRRRSERPH